jgi:hypothetical protein
MLSADRRYERIFRRVPTGDCHLPKGRITGPFGQILVLTLTFYSIANRHETIPSENRQTARPRGGALKP